MLIILLLCINIFSVRKEKMIPGIQLSTSSFKSWVYPNGLIEGYNGIRKDCRKDRDLLGVKLSGSQC